MVIVASCDNKLQQWKGKGKILLLPVITASHCLQDGPENGQHAVGSMMSLSWAILGTKGTVIDAVSFMYPLYICVFHLKHPSENTMFSSTERFGQTRQRGRKRTHLLQG